jgi:hypothetical protein
MLNHARNNYLLITLLHTVGAYQNNLNWENYNKFYLEITV